MDVANSISSRSSASTSVPVSTGIGERVDCPPRITLRDVQSVQMDPFRPLNQRLDRVLRTSHAANHRLCANRIQVVELRIFHAGISLREDRDELFFAFDGRLDRGDGLRPGDGHRHQSKREQHRILQGQNRKRDCFRHVADSCVEIFTSSMPSRYSVVTSLCSKPVSSNSRSNCS